MSGYVGNNAWNYYHITADTANNLVVTAARTSSSGDCDLYVRAGAKPTRFDYQYLDISTRVVANVTIINPQAETWYIGVFGWYPCEYVLYVQESVACDCASTLNGHCDTNSSICNCNAGWVGTACDVAVTTLTSGVPVRNNRIQTDQWAYYLINASNSSAFSLSLKEQDTTGLTWVFIDHNQFPTFTNYDYSDKNAHSQVHQISYYRNEPETGSIYIGVYGSPYIFSDPNSGKNITVLYDIVAWVSDF